jgi:hypothetical protein
VPGMTGDRDDKLVGAVPVIGLYLLLGCTCYWAVPVIGLYLLLGCTCDLGKQLAGMTSVTGVVDLKTGALEGIGEYGEAIFQVSLTFGKTETVADKGSCFGWAKYQGRNFCTAESILGFSRPVKYGLKRCPKSPKNGSRPARRSSETLIYKQIFSPAGLKKGFQKSSENRCDCDLAVTL